MNFYEEIEYCRAFKRASRYEFEIAKDASYSFIYAKEISELGIGNRFLLGEDAIATDAELSFYYARDILRGRFLAGETAISKSSIYALSYAIYIMKGRFLAAEPIILNSITKFDQFKNYMKVAKTRFPLFEHNLPLEFYIQYMNLINERIPNFESGYIKFVLEYLKKNKEIFPIDQQMQLALFCQKNFHGRWKEFDDSIDDFKLNQNYQDIFLPYEETMSNLGYPRSINKVINTKPDHTCEFVNISVFQIRLACKICGKDKQ